MLASLVLLLAGPAAPGQQAPVLRADRPVGQGGDGLTPHIRLPQGGALYRVTQHAPGGRPRVPAGPGGRRAGT